MSFNDWMDKVNEEIAQIIMLDSDDLPDLDYFAMFEDNATPQQAARKALENAGFYQDDFEDLLQDENIYFQEYEDFTDADSGL
jgi:hypothetical protein